MDNFQGKFEEISQDLFEKAEKQWPMDSGVFKVGEELEIKGSRFRVHAIKPKKLILKLLVKGV